MQERAQSVLNCLNSQFNHQVVQEVNEAALMRATQRCWNLLFLRRRREQRRSFPWWRAGRRIFRFCSHFLKKEQFPFPPGSQVHGTTVCDALLPHSCPRPMHYQMHPAPGLVCSDRPEGCLLTCFDPSATQTVPTVCVRRSGMAVQGPLLRFAFEGRAWQYRVLPFGLSLSPCVFTKVVEGALTPLREVGVRILNYLDDWLILAQSREQLGDPRDLVLWHLSQLGLRVDWEKSKLSPVQRISFLELDSVSMTARLTEERAQAVLNCLSSFRGRNVVPLKQFQRLLGHMASAAAVTPLGLLHMRPLQHWLHSRVPRWAWRRGTLRVDGAAVHCEWVSPSSVAAPSAPGRTLPFYGPRSAPRTSVPAYCCHNRCLQQGLGRYMQQAGSLGALDRAPTALAHQLPRAVGSAFSLAAVPATAVGQARASPHGKHCGGLVHQPAGRYTITPHVTARPPSPPLESHAVQVTACCSHPGAAQSCGRHALTTAHIPRRVATPSRDDPDDLESIRGSSGRPVCLPRILPLPAVLLPDRGPLSTDALAHSWPQALRKYAFPPVSLLAQTLCKLREDEEQVLLVAPHWPTRTWFPELISLATAPPWRIPLRKDLLSQGLGTIWHPRPDLWNLHVWLLDGTRQT